jgi:hypothetical protein
MTFPFVGENGKLHVKTFAELFFAEVFAVGRMLEGVGEGAS